MKLVTTLAFLLSVVAGAPVGGQEHGAPTPAVQAPDADSLASAIGAAESRGEQVDATHAVQEDVDIITPHITDSDHMEVPYWAPPFYKVVTLPHWKPIMIGGYALDLSPTKHVVMLWIAALLCCAVLITAAQAHKRHHHAVGRPHGFAAGIEAMVLYIRNEVALPNLGHGGSGYVPFILTIFFFILTMNLVGLVPGGHASTGSLNVTAGLAIVSFFVVQISSIMKIGLGAWLKHLTGGVHWALWPIMVPVEILGLFTKPFALCVRLFANMTAGHIVLLSLIGLSFVTAAFIPVTLGFSLFINILELLVAFIQAYIFTMLTAVFTGMGMASHDHDHGDEGHAAAH